MKIDYSIYLVTDSNLLSERELCKVVEDVICAGVTVVQLREKHLSSRKFYDLGCKIMEITKAHGIPLIINDRVDIMLALDADGVHVGSDDLPLHRVRALAAQKIVGYTVNNFIDLDYARQCNADYIGIGPAYKTTSKKTTKGELGVLGVKTLVELANMPAVAIGGITPERAKDLAKTGIAGICAISAILDVENPVMAVEEFKNAFISY